MRRASMLFVAAGVVFIALAPATNDVYARTPNGTARRPQQISPLAVTGTRQILASINQLVARSPMTLTASIEPLVAASGGAAAIALIELGGSSPLTWNYNGTDVFTAASTYKLAALMLEAQNIATGATDPNGLICYQDSDYEDGWFDDYADGICYTRDELARRAGVFSDNTAGHMLVRDVGGADVLNAWAASIGDKDSVFFTDNTTTAQDLATLWSAEAKGAIGGARAQAWLYPLLTGSKTEAGIPAGVQGRSSVVHKTGEIDEVEDDAALVTSGPNGAYVLVVMTNGLGGGAGWQLISSVSADIWSFEAGRK
ncbi:MAG TPA: serine hydrolase [Candidatus Dormibacteraeota bacterium]|nr:serine hydrolase [Candidatus Dormibacteraeota bacterium]